MNIFQRRLFQTAEETISILYIDGRFVCWILEDQHRAVKVKGDTRIPAGKYKLELRKRGGQHSRYKKDYPQMHRGMVHLLDVPNFKYIHFHIGNDDDDTAGCLLCGTYPIPKLSDLSRYDVVSSRLAYKIVYPTIARAIEEGDTYWEIEDEYK